MTTPSHWCATVFRVIVAVRTRHGIAAPTETAELCFIFPVPEHAPQDAPPRDEARTIARLQAAHNARCVEEMHSAF